MWDLDLGDASPGGLWQHSSVQPQADRAEQLLTMFHEQGLQLESAMAAARSAHQEAYELRAEMAGVRKGEPGQAVVIY